MIQAILQFQFVINLSEKGVIDPEFKPIQLVFNNDRFKEEDYKGLIEEADIYTVFYQHTTGIKRIEGDFSNQFFGRLKLTPFQVISYFKQEKDGSQFLTISLYELDDELEIFQELIDVMAEKLDALFPLLMRAAYSKKLTLIDKANTNLRDQLKLSMFQISRLSNLEKLQKVGLIFRDSDRIKMLETLRERPKLKAEMKREFEQRNVYRSVDILMRPFVELSLVRRDWIMGEKDEDTGLMENQGECLFLIKDIRLVRTPSQTMMAMIKEKEPNIFELYHQQVKEFFASYNPLEQTQEETMKTAGLLLNPDIYDFFSLMKNNYYPLDKIPKILSEWANVEDILSRLQDLKILTVIKDEKKRSWLILLCEISAITIFPEHILPSIRKAFKEKVITFEIAKKAYDLLEVTYPESVQIT